MRHRPNPISRTVAAIAAIAVLHGCNGASSGLSDYGQCILGGAGRHLTVHCLSSPFADRAEAERTNTARKVAEYVRDHDPKYKGAEDVTVVLLGKKESAAAEGAKHPGATYTFTHAELGSPPAP
jgi:hypothetical protein